jgi:hypothetical protein
MKGIFYLLLFCSGSLFAQNLEWARSAGELSRDVSRGVCVDANGNVIVTGYFSGLIKFDETYTGRGNDDVFIAKFDSAGNVLWVKTAGGPNDDIAIGIAADNEGNIFVAGAFDSVAFFDNVLLSSNGKKDVFIAKYSTTGDLLWAKRAGGSGFDQAFALAVDKFGEVYITGVFEGFAGFGNILLTSKGNTDVFIVKYDAMGNNIWAKRAGGSKEDFGFSIATDFERNCYITGSFNDLADFGIVNLDAPSVSSEIYVAKIDSLGQWEWVQQAGGLTGDASYAISVDNDRNAYITGFYSAIAYFGSFTLEAQAYNDIFVAKYSTKGLCVWAKSAGFLGLDIGTGISVANDGSVFVAGAIDSIGVFENDTIGAANDQDMFLAKWDKFGNYQWVRSGEGPNFQLAMATAVGKSNEVYVAGYYYAVLELGDTTLFQSQDADIFLLKYNDPMLSNAEILFGKNKLRVYPNPFQNSIYINYSNIQPDLIQVYDHIGRQVTAEINQLNNTTISVSLSNTSLGIYFIKCVVGKETVVIKAVSK